MSKSDLQSSVFDCVLQGGENAYEINCIFDHYSAHASVLITYDEAMQQPMELLVPSWRFWSGLTGCFVVLINQRENRTEMRDDEALVEGSACMVVPLHGCDVHFCSPTNAWPRPPDHSFSLLFFHNISRGVIQFQKNFTSSLISPTLLV